ncbi:MAG: hypothetical protein HC841_08420, partial [Verrucomicrobiae bacterium]|nr:hypothetical protein [Verrucomicrobiae bacterium]
MALDEQHPGEGYAEKALHASETARARSLLELLSEARVDVRQGITPGLKELERNNRDRLSKLQAQLIAQRSKNEPDRAKIAALEDELRQGEEERIRLQERIRTQHPRYASLQYPSVLSTAEIQPQLDPHTALLEYALSEKVSYLFVLTREGLTRHTLPGEAELAPQVEALREILTHPGRRGLGRLQTNRFLALPNARRTGRSRARAKSAA